MNYYVWVELKAFVGAMFFWDAFFTILKHSSFDQMAYVYLHSDLGYTASVFLYLGMLFLLSCVMGGMGFVSRDYRLLSNKHYISDTTISS